MKIDILVKGFGSALQGFRGKFLMDFRKFVSDFALFLGKGVMIAVVDVGVQYTNVDLMDQYDFTSAYNFYSSNLLKGYGLEAGGAVGLPAQELFDHGTQCAGLIAAKPNNSHCGVGIAHGSKFTSIIPFGPDALETKESLMSD